MKEIYIPRYGQKYEDNRFGVVGPRFTDQEAESLLDTGVLEHIAKHRPDTLGFILLDALNSGSMQASRAGVMVVRLVGVKEISPSGAVGFFDRAINVSGAIPGPGVNLTSHDAVLAYGFGADQRASLGRHAERVSPAETASVLCLDPPGEEYEERLRVAAYYYRGYALGEKIATEAISAGELTVDYTYSPESTNQTSVPIAA